MIPFIVFFLTEVAIILSMFLAFYIPGRVIFGKQKLPFIAIFTCSIVLGLVMWGWQGFIFGYLNARFLSYIYLVFFIIVFAKEKYWKDLSPNKVSFKKIDWIIVLMIIVGTLAQNILFFRAGLHVLEGMMLPSYNTSDHIWHASLTNEIVNRFPPFEPGMYGILLQNYHYWFNLVTGELIRVFNLPLMQTQFAGMYVLGSILLGLAGYIAASAVTKLQNMKRWLLFYLYFAGDAIYWLTLFTTGRMAFELSPIDDGTIFMDNPPRAFSVVLALTGFYLLFIFKDLFTKRGILMAAIVIGTIVGFKVYTAIAALCALLILSIVALFKRKYFYMLVFCLSCVASAIIFFPVNSNSGGLFFLPFELPRDFVTQETIGLTDWVLRWGIYWQHNNYFRIIQYGLMMSAVFLFAQVGVKLIGLFQMPSWLRKLGWEKAVFLFSAALTALGFGLFSYQVSGGSNVFNFFISAGLFLSILSAFSLTMIGESRWKLKYLIMIIVILVTLPRWFQRVDSSIRREFLSGFSGIYKEEVASFEFLKKKTQHDSLVLVMNNGHFDSLSPFVMTFSNSRVFLSGQWIIDSHNTTNKERQMVVDKIDQSRDSQEISELLAKYSIDYIYYYTSPELSQRTKFMPGKVVFTNNFATIRDVRH